MRKLRKKSVKVDEEKIMELFAQGLTASKIANITGNATASIYKVLNGLERKNCFREIRDIFCVYFLYSEDNLIYIGQTTNIFKRMLKHRENNWYNEITSIVCYSFDCSADMVFYEANEIARYKPKYNVRGKDSSISKYTIEYRCKFVYNTNGVLLSSHDRCC